MNTRAIIRAIVTPQFKYLVGAFFITCVFGILILHFIKKFHVNQHIRDDGPESHLKKEGTPSMGGLIFLAGIVFSTMVAIIKSPSNKWTFIGLLVVTVLYGLVGFLDDYIKMKKNRSLGLKAWQKMFLLLVVSGLFVAYMLKWLNIGTETYIPFYRQFFDIGYYFFIPFAILVLISTTNVMNITDGLDGIATGLTIIIMTFLTVISIAFGNTATTLFSAIVTGSCLAFLIYNLNPAKVFMGDTGSLALGGAIGAVSLILQIPILLILVAGICVIEALSDIAQVVYFKFTKGKRLLKMAPLHHHLELSGWSEKKIVWTFWIWSIVFAVLAFILV
jgi:phospho-N-acetylmuramoyl-pentapeptide-transferase